MKKRLSDIAVALGHPRLSKGQQAILKAERISLEQALNATNDKK